MSNQTPGFWTWHGTIDRSVYILWGLLLFAVKFNLDRIVAHFVFHRSWSIFNYFEQDGAWDNDDKKLFYQTMVIVSLPFIWIGVTLTLRRLRAAGLSLWLVVLFFVPIVNVIFFGVLSAIPSCHSENVTTTPLKSKIFLDRIIPETRWGSAFAAVFAVVVLTILGTAFSASFLRNYGGGLFIGMPFCLGLISTLIFGYHSPRRFGECMAVCMYAIILAGVALLIVAIEGIFCLLMAALPAVILAGLGGAVGYAILSGTRWREDAPKLFCTVFLAAPLLIAMERVDSLQAPLLEVKSTVEINAPPEKVWNNVVSFRELPPPNEWLFRSGIAYPVCAEIRGHGVGAVRHCVFSTGPFVEPIEIWDEPKLLQFSVTKNPAPMQEWTPYREIHPPHVNGFFISERGQFLLRPLADGRTLLEGTTWYRHNLWPVSYWKMWSDHIIHRIHLRVLNHVKHISETNTTK